MGRVQKYNAQQIQQMGLVKDEYNKPSTAVSGNTGTTPRSATVDVKITSDDPSEEPEIKVLPGGTDTASATFNNTNDAKVELGDGIGNVSTAKKESYLGDGTTTTDKSLLMKSSYIPNSVQLTVLQDALIHTISYLPDEDLRLLVRLNETYFKNHGFADAYATALKTSLNRNPDSVFDLI